MKSKKGYGITTAADYRPKSAMHLEGEHAAQASDHPIGRKVKVMVHATKMSHSKNADGTHSARYDINKIEKLDNEVDDKPNEGKAERAQGDGKTYSKHQPVKAQQ